MKKLVLLLCLTASLGVQAQKEKAIAYIASYKELAISEMMRTGVPAAITLAQGILESQFGESDLVKSSNNHFGIKCKPEWTGDRVYHDDDEKGECFRVYPTAAQSYIDHSDFLKSRPHYAFLFKLDPTDYEGWAKGLKKAGYATLSTYPQKLMKLINDYNLQQYSLDALARMKNGETPFTAGAVLANAEPKKEFIEPKTMAAPASTAAEHNEQPAATAAVVSDSGPKSEIVAEANSHPALKTVNYPQGIFTINHCKVIFGTAGTSLLSLANQYELPLSKLLEFNDMPEMDVLDADRLMFIEKKQKRGASDFHTVADGETLYSISQQEGVRFDNLLEYNNMKKEARVSPGDKIYLRIIQAETGKNGKNARKISG